MITFTFEIITSNKIDATIFYPLHSFFCLFVLGFCLADKKGKNFRTKRVLAIDLICCSIVFYIYGSFFVPDTDYENRYWQDIIYTFCLPMLYPLHMIYAKLLTDTKNSNGGL